MQEEVTAKTIAFAMQTTKMTASVLKAAMRKFLESQEKMKADVKSQLAKRNQPGEGKQTMKQLMKHNAELTNIEITDSNIRSFERVARKYQIDFSLKKDSTVTPPKYIVFFKAKDVDVMTTAFKEYSAKQLKKSKKPSVRKRLQKAQNMQKKNERSRDKTKQKSRGESR
jgi:hypothetical protein